MNDLEKKIKKIAEKLEGMIEKSIAKPIENLVNGIKSGENSQKGFEHLTDKNVGKYVYESLSSRHTPTEIDNMPDGKFTKEALNLINEATDQLIEMSPNKNAASIAAKYAIKGVITAIIQTPEVILESDIFKEDIEGFRKDFNEVRTQALKERSGLSASEDGTFHRDKVNAERDGKGKSSDIFIA